MKFLNSNLTKGIGYRQARNLITSYSDGIELLFKSIDKEMKKIKVIEVDKYGVREIIGDLVKCNLHFEVVIIKPTVFIVRKINLQGNL